MNCKPGNGALGKQLGGKHFKSGLSFSFQYSSHNSSGYGTSSSMASDPRAVDNALRWIADEKVIIQRSIHSQSHLFVSVMLLLLLYGGCVSPD